MPTIYLSPSTQEFNPYVDGGNEEYYMNIVADEMIPYLNANGIKYVRNDPNKNAAQAISESNSANYDFHLSLHSNAAPPSLSGKIQGSDVYYFPDSNNGKRAADIFVDNLKDIYPNPSKVKAVPTTSLGEVSKTKAPAILVEVAYHDNPEDAMWIRNNTNQIAKNMVISLTEYFGIPFAEPQSIKYGIVDTESTPLNIRERPTTNSNIISQIPKGASIKILSQLDNWYLTNYNGIEGYVASQYVKLI